MFNVQKGLSKKANEWLEKWIIKQHSQGRKCVFVVDESDEGQSGLNMQSLRNILKPELEIGFTASFKTGTGDVLYHRVDYREVVDAEMIVDNIYYEVSSEVAVKSMLKKAIERRNRLEGLTNTIRGTKRFFIPKMAIQTNASKAEEMKEILIELLNLTRSEADKQIKIHVQNERGLDDADMSEVRYIIGDLMIERGWNLPELYIMVVAKDSLSVAKGIQLLGRVMRLPDAERFQEEELQSLNAGYVYIAGQHTIQKSCEEFMNQGLTAPGGGNFGEETETVEIRDEIKLPLINTTSGEPELPIWSEELDELLDKSIDAIFNSIGGIVESKPVLRTGNLDFEGMSHAPGSLKRIEAEWNYEHTKDILRNALSVHFHRSLCERIVGEFHAEVLARNLNIAELSGKLKEAAKKIKKSQLFRRLSLMVELKRYPFVWSNSLTVIKRKSLSFSRCLYPKISGLNQEEIDFATVLNETCKDNGWYWFRNNPSDILVVKSGYPDFIVFNGEKFVFIEYKGVHLVSNEQSVLKNALGMMSKDNYYMIYKKDKEDVDYWVKGFHSEDEEVFNPNIHLGIYL